MTAARPCLLAGPRRDHRSGRHERIAESVGESERVCPCCDGGELDGQPVGQAGGGGEQVPGQCVGALR